MDVEAGYVHQPNAIGGDEADRVIRSMQLKFTQRGNNFLGLINQFATDLERDSSELCQSIDDSHDRVIEIGVVLKVEDKIEAIESACNKLRANLARSNHRFKRKVIALNQAMEAAKDMNLEDRQRHLEKNRAIAAEQKNKRAKESGPFIGCAPNVILMEDGRGAVAFDDREELVITNVIAPKVRPPITITETIDGVSRVALDESSESTS